MKNKAFTLIELLAVILILGIISLVAIMTITKLIDETKKNSFKTSINALVVAIENNCEQSKFSDEEHISKYTFIDGVANNSINVKGKLPDIGVILVDESCKTSVSVSNGTYTYVKDYDSSVTITSGNEAQNPVDIVYADGTKVYYNPQTDTICNQSSVVLGTGVNNTCMLWYIFGDKEDTTNVNLLLSHNVVAASTFGVDGSGLYAKLIPAIANWVRKDNVRLITQDEIKAIVGTTTTGNVNLNVLDADGKGKYVWLYEHTKDNGGATCTAYGCTMYDTLSAAYWTMTKANDYETSSRIRVVVAANTTTRVYGSNGMGIRPVIEIPKAIIQ